MSVATAPKITKADILGTERRWRRGFAPEPATFDDPGVFGPGSIVWEVLLHPATLIFQHAGQVKAQSTYKPITAGIRDWEPMSVKARKGELTMFHAFERATRGAGMHLPMWLGSGDTATKMAAHLHKVHTRVAGDTIDTGEPELGGYDAASPREAMWAGITELHPALRVYEAFAFRDGKLPHRLSQAQRDQFVAEMAAYLRLHGAPEEEIPTTTSELNALYERHAALFTFSETVPIHEETGRNYHHDFGESIKKNFQPSHLKAARPIAFVLLLLGLPVSGALPSGTRRGLGLSPRAARFMVASRWLSLPLAWVLQQPRAERHFLRLMWGPDGVALIESARRLHAEAKARA